MGEHADDMIDGTCCAGCGEFFHDNNARGFPRYCSKDCAPAQPSKSRTKRNRRKRDRQKKKRARALAAANTKGWESLTPYHFRRMINGEALDWWPSTGKYFWRGQVIDAAQAGEIMK